MTGGFVDRDDVLDRTELADVADELLGAHRGSGSGARWPSPVPGHPQTGRTPPMSIFTDRRGVQRWTCFATGQSGTAIDLVMTARSADFAEAVGWLADRCGIRPDSHTRLAPAPRRVRRINTARVVSPTGVEDLRRWVQGCADHYNNDGDSATHRWLQDRGLDDETCRRAGVGIDPGPHRLSRPDGLPKSTGAVVFPVYNTTGDVVYAQARALHGPIKYVNPASSIAPNPFLSFHPAVDNTSTWLVVTEGVPDALVMAGSGFDAVAVLGAGIAHREDIVARITAHAAGRPVVVCLDRDTDGIAASTLLTDRLSETGASSVAVMPLAKDVSQWKLRRPEHFSESFRRVVASRHRASLPGRDTI